MSVGYEKKNSITSKRKCIVALYVINWNKNEKYKTHYWCVQSFGKLSFPVSDNFYKFLKAQISLSGILIGITNKWLWVFTLCNMIKSRELRGTVEVKMGRFSKVSSDGALFQCAGILYFTFMFYLHKATQPVA